MIGLIFEAASILGGIFGLNLHDWLTQDDRQNDPAFYKGIVAESEKKILSSAMDSMRLGYGLICYLSHVARADGTYDENEKDLIKKIVQQVVPDLDLSDQHMSNEKSNMRRLLEKAPNDTTLPKVLFSQAREDANLRKALLTFGWRVAAADGRVTRKEIERMTKLGIEMRANMIEIEWSALPYYRIEGFESDKREICEYLGLQNNASLEAIKNSYQDSIKEIENKSRDEINDEEKTALSEKYARINEAYEKVTSNWQETEWYSHEMGYNRAAPMEELSRIRCVVCDRTSDRPIPERYAVARCPECQALLCYPQDKAIFLTKQD